ncbi:MAG: GTP-binding protein [Candidatus Lokiarchaeota archaeon]|nr:GTP-binding protein [Candidatus Lokiarchaeota archaeon]MBD3200444.1 GTP-binding protein [Candidatus Lokiarchaeota archaeon]
MIRLIIHSNRLYKVCIVGDGGVGKTTILHRYIDDKFLENTKMTIGTDFFIKNIELPEENASVKLQIWDLGGQDQFKLIRRSFYLGAKGIVYVFDLTNRFSFNNCVKWKNEIEEVIGKKPSILIANKLDLVNKNSNRPIPKKEGNNLKEDLGSDEYIETSAKEDIMINEAFRELAKIMHRNIVSKIR